MVTEEDDVEGKMFEENERIHMRIIRVELSDEKVEKKILCTYVVTRIPYFFLYFLNHFLLKIVSCKPEGRSFFFRMSSFSNEKEIEIEKKNLQRRLRSNFFILY